jgi:hypothetical protein
VCDSKGKFLAHTLEGYVRLLSQFQLLKVNTNAPGFKATTPTVSSWQWLLKPRNSEVTKKYVALLAQGDERPVAMSGRVFSLNFPLVS